MFGNNTSVKCKHIIFVLALIVSEILTFQIYYLEIVGQGHGVQLLQSSNSMANIKIYKCLT